MPDKKFGLGAIISLLDRVSGPAGRICRAFGDVERTAQMADRAVSFARKSWAAGWRIGLAGTAITAPFIAMTKSILDVNAALEKYEIQLITAKAGSVEAGRAMLDWAKEYAAVTPFQIAQVVESTSMLEIYGISAKKWFPLIGNMAGSMGKDVISATQGVAKALTGGGFDILRESFGITGQILSQFGFRGKMQTPADLRNLAEALEKFISTKFARGMEMMAKSWSGGLSMISDAIFQLKALAGEKLFEALKADMAKFVKLIQSPGFQEAAGRWAKAFGEGILTVIGWAKRLISPLVSIINWIDRLTRTHPTLLKYATAFTVIGGAALMAVGGLLMIASGLGWVAAGILHTAPLFKGLKDYWLTFRIRAMYATDAISRFASAAASAFASAAKAVWGFFTSATKAVFMFFATNPIGWVLLGISAIVLFALAWKNNWLGIGNFMNNIVGWIKAHSDTIIDILVGLLGPVGWVILAFRHWDVVGPIVREVVNKVAGAFVWLWNQITAGVTWLLSLPGKFWEAGRKMILGLWEGIKSVALWPINAIRDLAAEIRKYWPFSDPKTGPLRNLTRAGENIPLTLARGMDRGRRYIDRATANIVSQYEEILTPVAVVPRAVSVAPIVSTLLPVPARVVAPARGFGVLSLPGKTFSEPGMLDRIPKDIKIDGGDGAALGGGLGGGPTIRNYYITQHFERDSIRIQTGSLDAESFRDEILTVGSFEKRIEGRD